MEFAFLSTDFSDGPTSEVEGQRSIEMNSFVMISGINDTFIVTRENKRK